MDKRINHYTIVGGGSAGWMTAGLLASTLNRRGDGPDVEITLIESPSIPIVGVGEATTLSTFVAFAQMHIDEFDFLKNCDASFKSAVRFRGWDDLPDGSKGDYYHPFDSPPFIWGLSPAIHYLKRLKQGAKLPSFAHCMSGLPAMMDACKAPRDFESDFFEQIGSYSYHLDATLLGDYLKQYCTALGVTYISDDVVDVTKDERGYVSALELKERGTHPVEFVIDCSGFRSLILRQAMGEPFVPYGDHLLCDRALAVQIPHRPGAPLESYTTSTALGGGWSWNVPLYSRRGTGYVYSSQFRRDDEAIEEFLAHLGEDGKDAEPRVIPLNIGRTRHSWVKNCLAVGLSAGFIEPLESTSIHLIQVAIRRFIDYLPDRDCSPVLIDRYNRSITEMYEDIRDFIAMHYATSNLDTPFWKAARADDVIPDRVRARLELWRHKVPSELDVEVQNPLFSDWSFMYVLFGKHFFDDVDFPIESAVADSDFDEFLEDIQRGGQNLLSRTPDHRALLDKIHARTERAWYRPEPEPVPQGFATT
ncbi:MAG: tryptophan 7-halogenase [Rhodospirillaceae bacterium]|nr:tryptophan 7-halogenase [Rhodospirillaceae bacterium]